MDNNNNNNINGQYINNNCCIVDINNTNYEIPSSSSSTPSSSSSLTSSLSRRYYQLFISEKYSDCSFCIDDCTIKAHKLILSTASPVFETLLYGPLNLNDNNNSTGTKIIKISDISPEVFYKMLTFIYTSELNFNTENLQNTIELYYCGEKYMINELKQKSLIAIKDKLRFDNILETLDLAIYTNLESFIRTCLQFFEQYCMSSDNGATKFMLTLKSSYYHLSKDCIMKILNSSFGKSCEKYLYYFIKEWIRNDLDNKRQLNKNFQNNDNKNENILTDEDDDNNDDDDGNYVDNINNSLNAIIENQSHWNIEDNFFGNNYRIEQITIIERTYYKARQPFLINELNNKFLISIKSNQYTSLIALIIHSRLKPNPMTLDLNNRHFNFNHNDSYDYKESFNIEIYSTVTNANGDEQQILEYNQILNEKIFPYNCDINIMLDNKIILIPNQEYIIKFVWDYECNKGAEYPCSLMSNKSNYILFEDQTTYGNGSILKGLKLLNPEKRD